MTRETAIYDFLVKARLKLGVYAEFVQDASQYGGSIHETILAAAELRAFAYAVDSPYNNWTDADLFKRLEYIADSHKLVKMVSVSSDWLNRLNQNHYIQVQNPVMVQLPTGNGVLYMSGSTVLLDIDEKLTINDL